MIMSHDICKEHLTLMTDNSENFLPNLVIWIHIKGRKKENISTVYIWQKKNNNADLCVGVDGWLSIILINLISLLCLDFFQSLSQYPKIA